MEAESPDAILFSKSLQELRDLRSQLHVAAEYCEASFLRAPEKSVVMEKTKEYICQAVVAVVDHVGSVSSKLDSLLATENSISDTALRINCLNQKLCTCQEYSQKLALARLRWNVHMPRHHLRYVLPTDLDAAKLNGVSGGSNRLTAAKGVRKEEVEAEGETSPLFYPDYQRLLSKPRNCPSSPHGTLSMAKAKHGPLFHFQHTHKLRHGTVPRRSAWRHEFVGFLRRSKRST